MPESDREVREDGVNPVENEPAAIDVREFCDRSLVKSRKLAQSSANELETV